MNGWIYLALVSVLVCFEETQSKEWCYTRTKYYYRSMQVPVKICRQTNRNIVKGRMDPVEFSPVRVSSAPPGGTFTAKQFVTMFPGLFFNKTKADELDKDIIKISGVRPPLEKGPNGFKPLPQHDGDLHCPTFKRLEAAPSNLMNIKKERKEIVHFSSEGVYQYVHTGKCGSGSTQSCTSGGCHQEKSTVYLMVWQQDNPDWPTTFDPFEVDSYCSCKGITPSGITS